MKESDLCALSHLACALAAVALPLLLSLTAVPDSVLFNQLAATAGWGAWLLAARLVAVAAGGQPAQPPGAMAPALALLLCVCFAVLPFGRAQASGALVLLAGAAVLFAGARCTRAGVRAVAFAWWLAGLLSVIVALLQFFAPGLADGWLVATSATPGRAVGNLRQPNHLATALLCAMVMTAWLWQAGRLRPAWAAVSLAAMVLGVALSASRTGALALVVLLGWAALDRSQPRSLRLALTGTPVLYFACWAALDVYASLQDAHFYASERLDTGGDISSSRFAIWRNALTLIAQHPWTGVGWGNFNFAWTFTPFPDRPVAFFDHAHNLPLQLAVEIGVPATLGVLGLLGWAMWRARGALKAPALPSNAALIVSRRANAASALPVEPTPSIARAALAMLCVLALHSLLEYPLWYAYFLLPAAWTLGAYLGAAPADSPMAGTDSSLVNGSKRAALNTRLPALLLRGAGLLMVAGAAYAAWDHRRVEVIFAPPPGSGSLEARIARGQQSPLFGHHADYAAATNPPPEASLDVFRRPLHVLVDTRLLIAYIEALGRAGQNDRALYAAQRLREFRRPDAQAYFRACTPDNPAPPFQCETKPVPLTWCDMEP